MRKAFIAILLFASVASAQVSKQAIDPTTNSKKGTTVFFIDFNARPTSESLGYEGTNVVGSGAARHYLADKFYLQGSAFVGQDRKIITQDGYSVGGEIVMGLAFEHLRELEIETGVRLVRLDTSQFTKADLSVILKGRIHIESGAFLEVGYSNADRIEYVAQQLSEVLGIPVNLNRTNSFQMGMVYRQKVSESFGLLGQAMAFLSRYRDSFGQAQTGVSSKLGGGVFFIIK